MESSELQIGLRNRLRVICFWPKRPPDATRFLAAPRYGPVVPKICRDDSLPLAHAIIPEAEAADKP